MSTDKFDPEKYLNFHFGNREQYSRQITLVAMSGFLQGSLSQIITGAIKGKPKAVRQGFQVAVHDPLYNAAIRIKTEWMKDGVISPEQGDTFGAMDLYLQLRAGVPEDMINPGMFITGYGSEQGSKFKQN